MSISSSQGLTSKRRSFGDEGGLLGFLLSVGLQTLLSDSLLLRIILFVIGTKEIDVIIVVVSCGDSLLGRRGGRLSSLEGGHPVLKLEDEPLEVLCDLLELLVLKLQSTKF